VPIDPLSEPDFLRRVSRTFALSIRALPRDLRPAIELAYLLARLADTVADRSALGPADKLELLAGLRSRLNMGEFDLSSLEQARTGLADDPTARAESALLASAARLFHRWCAMPPAERDAVARVVTRLIATMEWEVQRFGIERARALRDLRELETYTEGIAGCVGAFWTELLVLRRRGVLPHEAVLMSRLGRRYGRGLQLVNIVRDVERDAERGIRFLPLNDDRQARLLQARAQLLAGLLYTSRLPVWQWRVRIATLLPAALGLATIRDLQTRADAKPVAPIKISKPRLLLTLAKCLALSLLPRGPLLLAR
jgi:farnesyl-diphosphate farnesyltransferase